MGFNLGFKGLNLLQRVRSGAYKHVPGLFNRKGSRPCNPRWCIVCGKVAVCEVWKKYVERVLGKGRGLCLCKLISLAVAAMMLTAFGMYIYHNEIGITLMVVEIMSWFWQEYKQCSCKLVFALIHHGDARAYRHVAHRSSCVHARCCVTYRACSAVWRGTWCVLQ